MLEAARNLEFEKAAQLRDQLKQLRAQLFGVIEEDHVDDAGRPPLKPRMGRSGQADVPASTGRRKAR